MRRALFVVALCALAAGSRFLFLSAQSPAGESTSLPRLPDGHPDLQGLWLKSAGGFQGLFIGSLDGTNFAAPGGGRGAAKFVPSSEPMKRP